MGRVNYRRNRPPARPPERPRVMYHPDCFLAHHGLMESGDPMPPCTGSLVWVHLIPRQLLRREHLPQLDPRTYVYACGGIMGNTGHHGLLDASRRLRVPFEALPVKVVEFAEEHGLGWWLEREYRRAP